MNKCLFKSIRHKKGELYLYCKNKRKIIADNDCVGCSDKEYKKYKPINKKSKHKEVVTPETYAFVYIRDKGVCQICCRKDNTYDKQKDEWVHLELHHINGRGKSKTNNPKNCCMLCSHCHHQVVHKCNEYWRPALNEMMKEKE